MNNFIDTHAHIDDKRFDEDRDLVLTKCSETGVKYIIDPAVNFSSCERVFQLSKKYDMIFSAFGIHPHDSKEANDHYLNKIEELLEDKKAVAVGEIGLDYYYDFSPKDTQKAVFKDFIKLAKKIKKPVIIHNRNSDEDVMEILESEYSPDLIGQFHCFSGNVRLAQRVLNLGFYISFTGSITFSKNKYAEIVEMVPIDKILLETDSPYMAPVPHRGRRADPTMIPVIVKRIAEIKKVSEDVIYENTYKNTFKLFNNLSQEYYGN